MTLRINYMSLGAKAVDILMTQEAYLKAQFSQSDSLSIAIWELVKLRVSQVNQCAFCIDMHSRDALELGESAQRLIGLNAWRELPFYTHVECAALEWAEWLTLGQEIHDIDFNRIKQVMGEQAIVDLTIAVNAINSWNRVAKTFKPEIGCFTP